MNQGLHRVIFNAARGVRMVVAETANGAGKGNSSGNITGTGSASTPGWRATVFGMGWTALAAMSMLGYAAGAHAQIVPNPFAAAGQKPQVLVAPNGVPLVNITTPSAGGVSINQYRQFDVNAAGAILNNSRTTASTQLGGLVQGNPWLATGPARIIVNQVSSSNPSYLNGYIEVAGQRAEVIIANPSGINVNGGGFINTSRATLTTGTPQYGTLGTLDTFLVQGGTITVSGNGLDLSTTDYAAILSRALQVNAAIYASELKVVTGANQISADHAQVAPTAGTGNGPTFALDVSALGGMYAKKITLIGTEAGLGVRNAGNIGASAGIGATRRRPGGPDGIGRRHAAHRGRRARLPHAPARAAEVPAPGLHLHARLRPRALAGPDHPHRAAAGPPGHGRQELRDGRRAGQARPAHQACSARRRGTEAGGSNGAVSWRAGSSG